MVRNTQKVMNPLSQRASHFPPLSSSSMVLPNPNNGSKPEPDLNKGGTTIEPHRLSEAEIDSNCSTPYVSAPSSPGRGPSGYFFSAPASPMHYVLSSTLSLQPASTNGDASSFEFEFSSRFSENASIGPGSMSSADELFCNGQIRPMKLSSHLQRPQFLAPLLDPEVEEDEGGENCHGTVMRGRDLRSRNRSMHRKTRSMSPLRNSPFRWPEDDDDDDVNLESGVAEHILDLEDNVVKETEISTAETTPSTSASSSRSSSSGRNSKKWIFLKDFLYRSKSEGRANAKEKFWSSVSFSPAKEKHTSTTPSDPVSSTIKTRKAQKKAAAAKQVSTTNKPANGVVKRRPVTKSAHELHYTANRAQAEEMKKKTYLPYRQGLFGCLGFSSKSYGAFNGFSRTLNPVSSR